MKSRDLDNYAVYVKLIVVGENDIDALEYATSAIDHSDILDQDGVIGVEIIEDAEPLDEDIDCEIDEL